MALPDTPRPTFVIIGAQRCATRWLRFNLDQHPDVFVPTVPLDYFAPGVPPFEGPPFGDARRTTQTSARWYGLQFVAAEDVACVGDWSPTYLAAVNHPGSVAIRMDETLPDVRLVAVVRQPVDRLRSAVARAVQTGLLAPGTDLVELVEGGDPRVDALDLVAGGRYARTLHPFVKRFGDRLLVLRHDEVVRDPGGAYESVLRHIGADPDFRPDGLERPRFTTRGLDELVPLDGADRRRLYRLFRSDVEELEALLDWDLSAWDPGPAPDPGPAGVSAAAS